MGNAEFIVAKSADLQTARIAGAGEIDMANSGALEKVIAETLTARSVATLVADLAE